MTDKKINYDFSCDNCGKKITAYPPDGTYTLLSVKRCCEKSLERFYECDSCDNRNKRFWCYSHFFFASGSTKTDNDPYDDYRSSSFY